MIDHSHFKKWFRTRAGSLPQYEAMIELKLIWSGQGRAGTLPKIRADLRKLSTCLNGQLTKEAHMILIDGLDRRSTPYYSSDLFAPVSYTSSPAFSRSSRYHLASSYWSAL